MKMKTKLLPLRRLFLLAQLSSFQHFIPWISLLAGFSGSLHCIGMCGGLVAASSETKEDILQYQLGRLLSYLALGSLGGVFGNLLGQYVLSLNLHRLTPFVAILPGLFIGFLFLFWGIQNLRGKSSEIPLPNFLGKLYGNIWKKYVYKRGEKDFVIPKSFLVGLMSILLPCGLLYGMLISTFVMTSPLMAMSSMLAFWIGTLPAMVFAPGFFQKIINPLKKKNPHVFAISLILIGLVTVSFRIVHFQHISNKTIYNSSSESDICH